ncbi:glycosyltransferase family 39 protein [Candidatus Sumerlaeota bacterium]|nr:glycosyltransferase family 39 protein [Candidatus Sumerlaeota bacterium]
MLIPLKRERKIEYALVIFLFLFALALRLPFIHRHPPGLWYDEAINGLDGLSVIGNIVKTPGKIPVHGFPIFFTTQGHPREPMFMYLVGLVFLFLKPTLFSLKLPGLLIGAMTVPLVYLLVKGSANNRRLAFLAALSLLGMRWHIHNSRLALRAILLPFWMGLSFFTFFEAVKKQGKVRYLVSGIVFGLGFYTHLSFRFAPFILGICLIHLFRREILVWKKDRKNLSLFLLAGFLVFLPLGIDYIRNPFHFFGRLKEVSLFENGVASGFRMILKNIVSTLLMFSFRGDRNPYLNIPGAPVLTPLASLFFYGGIYLCLRRIREPFSILVFSWIAFMLSGTILSTEAPHFGRSFGACVPTAIFTGFGLNECYEWIYDFFRKKRAAFITGSLWFIIASCDLGLYYGKEYRSDARLWYRTNAGWTEAARKTVKLAEQGVRVFLPGDLYRHPTVQYVTLGVSDDLVRKISIPEALSGAPDWEKRDHAILATQFNMMDSLLQKEIPSVEILSIFRNPEGKPWAIFYLLSRSSLLPIKQSEEILKRYQPDTER